MASPSAKTPRATDVFDHFVEDVLRSGGYLNTEDIVTGLSSKIADLHHLSAFKGIQGTNKVVHAAVLCYWQGRSIRIFSEMERFVTKQVAGYRQLPTPPEIFEDLGMGCLAKHEAVVKLFGFYDLDSKVSLPEVTSTEVLLCMQEFTARNRQARPDDKLEAKFVDYLRAHFGRNTCGVSVEFRSLFHSTNQTRGAWFGELRAAKEQYATEYKKALHGALQRLVETPPPGASNTAEVAAPSAAAASGAEESRMRAAGVDMRSVYSGLGALGLKAQSRFPEAAVFLYTQNHANPNRRFGLAAEATVSTTGVDRVASAGNPGELSALFTLVPDKSAYVQLRSPPAKRATELLQSSVVGLMVHLRGCGGEGARGSEGEGDAVRSWFDEQLAADVPEACLAAVQSLLKKLVAAEGFFDVGSAAAGAIAERAAVDWSAIRQQLGAILGGDSISVTTMTPGKKKKEKVEVVSQCVRMVDYMGVVTAVVLFQRILSTRVATSGPALSVSSPAEVLVDHIASKLSALATAPDLAGDVLDGLLTHPDGAIAAFFSALRWAEQGVTSVLSIPAFECTRTGGSFLRLMEDNLRSSLQELEPAKLDLPSQARHRLLAAVQALQAAIFPVRASADVVGEQRGEEVMDGGDSHERVEAALACVHQQLQAVLNVWEFESPEEGSAQAVANVLLALLLDVEARASEEGALRGVADCDGGATSFLRLLCTILDGDPQLVERLSSVAAARGGLADVACSESYANHPPSYSEHALCEVRCLRILLSCHRFRY